MLRSILFEHQKHRFALLAIITLLFLGIFCILHPKISYIVNLYFGIPTILCAYYYGFFSSLLLVLFQCGIHVIVLKYEGEPFAFIFLENRIRIAFISIIIVSYIVSLFRLVKNKLEESEKRYKAATEELRQINATKDKFFSIIAHDLRGPISSINTSVSILINHRQNASEKEIDEMLHSLKSLSGRVYNLLENLLKWSLIQKNEMQFISETLNVKAIANECVLLFEELAKEKNISITNNIANGCTIFADRNAVSTIFRNMISNALKFTNEGGVVALEASERDQYVCIAFIDNGIGMKEQRLGKLFKVEEDVVAVGTNGEQGTGLGLILCNEIARKCNGSIEVESQPNEGSTFTVLLPKG